MVINTVWHNIKPQEQALNPFIPLWSATTAKVSRLIAAGAPIFKYGEQLFTHAHAAYLTAKTIRHFANLEAPCWEKIPAFLVNEIATAVLFADSVSGYMGRYNPQSLPYWDLLRLVSGLYQNGKDLLSALTALKKAKNPEQERLAYAQCASAFASLAVSLAECVAAYYALPYENATFVLSLVAQISTLCQLYLEQTISPPLDQDIEIELAFFTSLPEEAPFEGPPQLLDDNHEEPWSSLVWQGPL